MRLTPATGFVLALAAGACGVLPDESNVVDLRVLGVRCEPAGFLVNLDDPGMATDDQLEATLTALVVDPTGAGQELHVNAVGCPDYIDTVTSATNQGSKLCPPADATSQIPDPIGSALATTPAPGTTPVGPVEPYGFEYNPTVNFGLTRQQIITFFTLGQLPIPAVEQAVAYNRDFGLPAIVNLDFELNGQRTIAIKRVVYWPRLKDEDKPDPYRGVPQEPNKNPDLGEPGNDLVPKILFYSHRDEATGNPDGQLPDFEEPTISISAENKLYVAPNYLNSGAVESYLLRVRNPDTMAIETRVVDRELLRFYFYATRGKFDPNMQFSELSPVVTSGMLHTDAEWLPPSQPETVPAEGLQVTIWIVVHDERAGTAWASRTIKVVP